MFLQSPRLRHVFAETSGRTILLTKTTAAQNEGVLSYYRVRGLYFLEVVFVASILRVPLKNSTCILYSTNNDPEALLIMTLKLRAHSFISCFMFYTSSSMIYYFYTRKHYCCQGIGGQVNLVNPSCYRKTCK